MAMSVGGLIPRVALPPRLPTITSGDGRGGAAQQGFAVDKRRRKSARDLRRCVVVQLATET
jgi:hypothetical protein